MKRKDLEPSKLEEPTDDFIGWWSPFGSDKDSGADIGGHPEAERVWARKDPGKWTHRTYGTSAKIAWNTQHYRSEYLRWVEVGRPEQEDFISLAAPLEKQKQFWKPLIEKIAKPMPEPEVFDNDSQNKLQPY